MRLNGQTRCPGWEQVPVVMRGGREGSPARQGHAPEATGAAGEGWWLEKQGQKRWRVLATATKGYRRGESLTGKGCRVHSPRDGHCDS